MKNKNLATIHILKNKLALPEENYRALLLENYNVTSSKELPTTQQKELIYLLNSQVQDVRASLTLSHRTVTPRALMGMCCKRQSTTQMANTLSHKQENYILFLSQQKVSNLSTYRSKIIKRTINNIKELTKSEAITIINSLKRYERKSV